VKPYFSTFFAYITKTIIFLTYQFQYPQAFWLLLLVPFFLLLFVFYQLWKKKATKRMGDPALVKKLSLNHSKGKSIFKIFILLFAFAFGCLALANPRKPDESSEGMRKGIDIVIAMDVSNSMLATDIAPDRLSRAKQFISKLVDNLQDDRIGLVVFAGNAYVQMPLTFDKEAAKMYVSTAKPGDIIAQGTSISEALKKTELLLDKETERFKSIILITDGETHDENALQTAKELASKGIMINTIGIGSPDGSYIVDIAGNTKRDASGQAVITKLNEQILQQIATSTNGKYIHLETSDAAVKEVMSQLSQIEKRALGDTSLFTYKSFYTWLVIPMLLLLILETFIPDRKKIKI
jgi:Ca-activated chloride channel family protein